MKDAQGTPLKVGDKVAYAVPGNNKNLTVGVVRKVTPKGLSINISNMYGDYGLFRTSAQVVLVESA